MDIKFSGVTKIFEPDIVALEDIYLQISKGEFVYLVGETGSGKTTLMRCVMRDVIPTRGHISAGGRVLRKINRFNLALFRRNIGVVFQDFMLLPNLTVKRRPLLLQVLMVHVGYLKIIQLGKRM